MCLLIKDHENKLGPGKEVLTVLLDLTNLGWNGAWMGKEKGQELLESRWHGVLLVAGWDAGAGVGV